MKVLRTLLLALAIIPLGLCAQGGKAFLKEGDALRKQGLLPQAIEKYDLAIAVDPKFTKAYEARAEVNTLLGDLPGVARDRAAIAEIDPGEARYAANAAIAYLAVDSPATARNWCERALRIDRKNMEALQAKVRACLTLNDLDGATAASDEALELKATTDTYYLHGLVRSALKDHRTAEADLDRVLEWNHLFEPAYIAGAKVQLDLYEEYSGLTMQMRALEKAISLCSTALELDPQSTDALFWRSKAYGKQKEYAKAIDDISRCMALGRQDKAVFHQRASYYHGFGQFQNAVNDLNRILLIDPEDVEHLLFRAECAEANLNLESALLDLESAERVMERLGSYAVEDRKRVQVSKERIASLVFERGRESDPPRLTVLEPFSEDGVAQVSATLSHLKVSGHVLDRSRIASIKVNGSEAQFSKEEKDPQFFTSIPWLPTDERITVEAVDVYGNPATVTLVVERSEGIPPVVEITSPLPENGTLVMEPGKESVFLEGRVQDASLIRMVSVNGVHASYAPDMNDPEFSIKLDLANKDRIQIHVEDQYGNSTDRDYRVIRKAEPVATKPAPAPVVVDRSGATWVVRIENSAYKDFPSVPATSMDAGKMRKAFSTYSIGRTIQKKDLTKAQMERFFNVELRDLVRSNKVATILVWYSGHGRSTGGKAFWVPVDAKKDDIYSYFNYGMLKSQMENYSESVNKTVVVSDVASDDSFFELTR